MRFALALAAMALASSANAARFYAELRGTLTSQVDNSFSDPNLKVGDVLTMKAVFRGEDVGFDVATGEAANTAWAKLDYPVAGNHYFRIKGGGFTWKAGDDINSGPYLDFASGHVTALHAGLVEADAADRPGLEASSAVVGLNGPDSIFDAHNFYNNGYKTPGFIITWDYSGSVTPSVTASVHVGLHLGKLRRPAQDGGRSAKDPLGKSALPCILLACPCAR